MDTMILVILLNRLKFESKWKLQNDLCEQMRDGNSKEMILFVKKAANTKTIAYWYNYSNYSEGYYFKRSTK